MQRRASWRGGPLKVRTNLVLVIASALGYFYFAGVAPCQVPVAPATGSAR
jgi:hypothetical protein